MRFRRRLLLSYIVLIALPLVILGTGFYYATSQIIFPTARDNILQIISKSNQILDERLAKTRDDTLMLMVECDLYQVFADVDVMDDYARLQADKKVKIVLNRHFSEVEGLYSAQLLTRDFLYGDRSKNTVPTRNFYQSELYRVASAADGSLAWIPTFTYSEMYGLPELRAVMTEYRMLFSATRTVTPSCVVDNAIVKSATLTEKPVLVLNFLPKIYEGTFANSLSFPGSSYMIVSPDGHIVAHEDPNMVGTTEPIEDSSWLQGILGRESGTDIVTIDGHRMIAGFATSPVTGWTSIYFVPQEMLMRDVLRAIGIFTISSLALLLVLSMLFAYLLSARIASPISKLMDGIRRAGVGDFDVELAVDESDEFGQVLDRFNSMNRKIKTLINENYIGRIREKETEILALNVQLNPHFLYNTLNTIHWMALDGDRDKVSEMLVVLSRMLHYTTDNRQDSTAFRDDLAWLKDYLQIMQQRYGGRFEVEFDIEPELMETQVPKLFLQPIVENSVLHGFQEIDEGGRITIYGRKTGTSALFIVEDNGRGMPQETVDVLNRGEELRHGDTPCIGLHNVAKRVQLLYGEEYGLSVESDEGIGTRVTVLLPFRASETATLMEIIPYREATVAAD